MRSMVTLPMTLSDLTAPFSLFCTAFHIFVMGIVRNFKFGL